MAKKKAIKKKELINKFNEKKEKGELVDFDILMNHLKNELDKVLEKQAEKSVEFIFCKLESNNETNEYIDNLVNEIMVLDLNAQHLSKQIEEMNRIELISKGLVAEEDLTDYEKTIIQLTETLVA